MTTVGMLSHRKDPKTVFKAYSYAAAAKMEGVEFVFFSPGRVNLSERTIFGWVYEGGQWVEKTVPFPDVIYNISSAQTSEQQYIIDHLRKVIPFTSYAIGDKISVYERIKVAQKFAQYLIPSFEIMRPKEVTSYLSMHPEIIVKPVTGHKGNDVIHIKKAGMDYSVNELHHSHIMTKQALEEFIKELSKDATFLFQPFIQSKTKGGLAYTLRLHTQKNGNGQWTIATIYPQIAVDGVVANLSKGGYTSELTKFLKYEFGDSYFNIKRTLEQFALQFSKHFDSLYEDSLDELGMDVGLDDHEKIWLYEVNWRPGVPPIFNLNSDITRTMIRYACYLHQTWKGGKKQ